MPTYAVQYEYVTDGDRLDAVRPSHRAFLRGLLEDGALLASGPLSGVLRSDPEDDGSAQPAAGALLLVRAADTGAACRTLDADPFWVEGLVVRRTVRAWDPVIGPFAG